METVQAPGRASALECGEAVLAIGGDWKTGPNMRQELDTGKVLAEEGVKLQGEI